MKYVPVILVTLLLLVAPGCATAGQLARLESEWNAAVADGIVTSDDLETLGDTTGDILDEMEETVENLEQGLRDGTVNPWALGATAIGSVLTAIKGTDIIRDKRRAARGEATGKSVAS